MRIVAEAPAHAAAVAALNRAAFGGDDEAALVERLHHDGLVVVSLVAVEGGDVVGHILFSDLAVEMDGRPVAAVALAPLAVRPDRQRRGIGGQLIREGLRRIRDKGRTAVIVLGHPDYYRRFGFSGTLASRLRAPFAGPAFMALDLVPGALAGRTGSVRYPAAFGDFERRAPG